MTVPSTPLAILRGKNVSVTSSAAVRGHRAGLVIVIGIVVLGHGPDRVQRPHCDDHKWGNSLSANIP